MNDEQFKETAEAIGSKLKEKLKKHWDGKECVLFMKDANSKSWKQSEWPGFYFEYISNNILKDILEDRKAKYGNVTFDAFLKIPWDFKAHSNNNTSKCPTNGLEEIKQAINEHGCVGLIIAEGHATYDDEQGSFKKWHDELKGPKSEYVKRGERIGRRHRKRKKSFDLKKIIFIRVNKETLENQGTFQKGMINADGSSRNAKLMVDLTNSQNDISHEEIFD